jgi:hypothetical protein
MWSMGLVKEHYLQFKKAGDQYLGRVVSGLDVNDVSFAIRRPILNVVTMKVTFGRRFLPC